MHYNILYWSTPLHRMPSYFVYSSLCTPHCTVYFIYVETQCLHLICSILQTSPYTAFVSFSCCCCVTTSEFSLTEWFHNYAGYSVAVGEKNNVPLYFTGAPRYEYKGQVVLFQKEGNNWKVARRVNGSQVGNCLEEICHWRNVSKKTFNTSFLLIVGTFFVSSSSCFLFSFHFQRHTSKYSGRYQYE